MQNKLKKWLSVILTAVIVFTTTMTDYFTGSCQTVLAQEQTDTAATVQDMISSRTDLYTKAEELKTPLAIYNYVRNNINYEYYGGMRKGADGVYDSLAGNDADTACLLCEMLNAAGYETRYVSGTIRVDGKLAQKMTGIQDIRTAARIFALSGESVSVVQDADGNVVYLEMPHTWIECYVPYTDYRGAGNCQGEYLWVPMDAGIKTYEDVDSIYDYTDCLGGTEQTAEEFAASRPDLYVVSRKIVQQNPAYLPLSLPYETVGELSRSAEYEGASDTITFVLGQGSRITLSSPELYNKRLTLCYVEQDGMVRPELKLEGKTIAAGSLMEKGQDHQFTMIVQSGKRKNVIENTLRAGGIHAIITDTQSITSKELDKAAGELTALASTVNEKNVYTDEYLGVLLDYAGKMYFAQVDIANRMMAEEMNVTQTRSLSVGILGYSVTAEYENGIITGISDGTLYTDIDLDFHMAASNSGSEEDVKRYMLASGMISSAYESAIWEQLTGGPSVSTVSILNEAYESGNPLLAVTDKNLDEVMKMLSATPAVLSAVKSEALAGKLVIIPQDNVEIGDWNGTGWISLEGAHYTGQYMINGGFTGTSTNGGSGSFKVGSAYLVNLIASSVDMAESLRMTKLVLAGLELGGVIGSLLGVAVLLLCVTLFVLAVEEYKANVDNMFAYQSGDESAGDAIAVNAGINIAVTAAFSGTGYLAKKQLAKYAAKQVTDKLGEELAERLLKDGADSTVIAKAIRSLEKSGVDNTLIRKAAAQMTAAEFDRIGALAKRGLAGELLEKVVDNRAVLGKVSDSTLLLLRGSKNSADDIITVLLRHGDEAGRLYGQYGDDVIEVALRYGDEGLEGIRRHGTDFLIEYFAYGDEFVQNYFKYGDEAVEAYVKYGDDAAKVLASSVSSFAKDIDTVLDAYGMTLKEFHSLRLKDIAILTEFQKNTLKAVRESVPPLDADTLMQKVIPAGDIEKYMDGTYTQVKGFMCRAEDVTQLKTYDDIFEGLRLDYPKSEYNPDSDVSLGVIRFKTEEYSKISVPYGIEMGGVCDDAFPFTGNGFTGATNGQIIPEYISNDFLPVSDGAQLIEIDKDGIEKLKAVYSNDDGMFIPVK